MYTHTSVSQFSQIFIRQVSDTNTKVLRVQYSLRAREAESREIRIVLNEVLCFIYEDFFGNPMNDAKIDLIYA